MPLLRVSDQDKRQEFLVLTTRYSADQLITGYKVLYIVSFLPIGIDLWPISIYNLIGEQYGAQKMQDV
jgi:hypothetical protein